MMKFCMGRRRPTGCCFRCLTLIFAGQLIVMLSLLSIFGSGVPYEIFNDVQAHVNATRWKERIKRVQFTAKYREHILRDWKDRGSDRKFVRDQRNTSDGASASPASESIPMLFVGVEERWPELHFVDQYKKWTLECDHVEITANLSRLNDANLIVLELDVNRTDSLDQVMRIRNESNRLAVPLVLLTLEPNFAVRVSVLQYILNRIDALVSFSKHSTVQIDYTYAVPQRIVAQDRFPLHTVHSNFSQPLASFFVTNCGWNGDAKLRREYIEEMQLHLPPYSFHSYGSCIPTQNRDLLVQNTTEKVFVQSMYKFAIAFENSVMNDYITEKFFEGLQSWTVPVYMGAPNIHQYLPSGGPSIVNALDFATPADLAKHLLALASDPIAYNEYLKWKPRDGENAFAHVDRSHSFTNQDNNSWICRLAKWYLDHSR